MDRHNARTRLNVPNHWGCNVFTEKGLTMQHDNNPSRAHIYPSLDGPHMRDTYYDWVMICFTWLAGFITCYLWLTN
jgi:hypothetical protein